jgi:hypothetical protein
MSEFVLEWTISTQLLLCVLLDILFVVAVYPQLRTCLQNHHQYIILGKESAIPKQIQESDNGIDYGYDSQS